MVWALGFNELWGLGFTTKGYGVCVLIPQGLGFGVGVQGLGFWVFWVGGPGFEVWM